LQEAVIQEEKLHQKARLRWDLRASR